MNVYLYDGTYSQLLKLITKLISLKIKPTNICSETNYQPNLFTNAIKLNLKEDFKNDFNLDKRLVSSLYYIYLSNNINKELIIYYFLLNALKYKNTIYNRRNLNCVNQALKVIKRVTNEAHKWKGFTRFKEINSRLLYAEINPDNYILPILGQHFSRRLKNEYWLIKDVNHNMYIWYDLKKYYLIDGKEVNFILNDYSKQDEEFEQLWKTFFKTIGIAARKNSRCQMNFMPKKYWSKIIEMEDANAKSNN